jgi:hypothetical protein
MDAGFFRRFAVVIAIAQACALSGCASDDQDDTDDSSDAMRVLRPAECAIKTKNTSSTVGVFESPISGCILGRNNVTGAAMLDRAAEIVSNPSVIGAATNRSGEKMFASFKAGAVQGRLAPGSILFFDAKVSIETTGPNAGGTLRFAATRFADGSMALHITNTTAIGAFGFNAIEPNGIDFMLRFSPAQNGVVVGGSVKVVLVKYRDQAGNVSNLAPDIVNWLQTKLNEQ